MRHLPRLRGAVSASLCCSSLTHIRTTTVAAVATASSSTTTQATQGLQRRTLATSVTDSGAVEIQTPPQGLKPPSKGWQVAVRPDQITDPAYVPAQDGLELEEVGGLDGWWENPANYGVGKEWVGFGPAEKVTDPAILEVTVYRALVEALLLSRELRDRVAREAVLSSGWGPLALTTTAAKTKFYNGPHGTLLFVNRKQHPAGFDAILAALKKHTLPANDNEAQNATLATESEAQLESEANEEIETAPAAEQEVEVKEEAATVSAAEQAPEAKEETETAIAAEQQAGIAEEVETAVAAEQTAEMQEEEDLTEGVIPAEKAQVLLKKMGHEWKRAMIRDPILKFFAAKRIQKLTGHKIPDGKLVAITTAGSLVKELVKPPKAKKLAEEIENNEIFQSLPNVKVFSRRVTPIDKEKMVGRWKVIREELERRGLPVIGTANIDNAIEKKWVTGAK